jgi:hypothetical protein
MSEERSERTKNMVLRLDPALAESLQAVAEVEGRSMADVVREAIAALVQQRRTDPRFQRLLEENLIRHERILTLLRGDAP